ncbi:Hypothetical predicted protein [Paramuricea clavata]|uniref:Uncharacterized protein n=1 Tax=Paramuricea clavata TaxID=317549 RepID=A0A6S7IUB3_PARCT|nr:Hypothetical predicted protein [Paramuricea clavata]
MFSNPQVLCKWLAYLQTSPAAWEAQSHLAVVGDLLLYDDRIVIPRAMRVAKCRARARDSVWWPGLSTAIQEMVSKCYTCTKRSLFRALVLSRHPKPSGSLRKRMASFIPQAQLGILKRMEILRKNQDLYLALLSYHSTPLQNGLSPSQLLMGRRLKTQLPVLPAILKPKDLTSELESVVSKEKSYRRAQEMNFNRRHRARELPTFESGDAVWVKDQSKPGEILSSAQYPRSYLVKTDKGILRRNRSALVSFTKGSQKTKPIRPEQIVNALATQQHFLQPVPLPMPPIVPPVAPTSRAQSTSGVQSTQYTTTRSGRVVQPPQRLDL